MKSSKKNKDNNAISLSTMHSSKGLEWDRVFIIDTHMIPSKNSLMKRDEGLEAEYEEEVRTFFVAITRPRKKLTILQPKAKNNQSVTNSQFFEFCSDYVEGKSNKPIKFDKSKLEDIRLDEIKEGMDLYHYYFGLIHINKIYKGEIAEVFTEDGRKTNLLLTTCIDNKFIKKI